MGKTFFAFSAALTQSKSVSLSFSLRKLALVTLLLLAKTVAAQSLISVSEFAWLGLLSTERTAIQSNYVVSLVEQNSVGVIIDNQGVNESTGGTTGGAQLGGAVANAAYIDKAIRGGNYSATNQLAVGILGAVLGSSLDSNANAKFHYRYAVKFGSGDIKYFDEIKGDAFRHPVGVCVSVPNIALIDQQLCNQTAASLRSLYLATSAATPVTPPSKSQPAESQHAAPGATLLQIPASGIPGSVGVSSPQVNCKLGNIAPVRTSAKKCQLINGSQVQ